jgi:hypothetical protein
MSLLKCFDDPDDDDDDHVIDHGEVENEDIEDIEFHVVLGYTILSCI